MSNTQPKNTRKTVVRYMAGYFTGTRWMAVGYGDTLEKAREDLESDMYQNRYLREDLEAEARYKEDSFETEVYGEE